MKINILKTYTVIPAILIVGIAGALIYLYQIRDHSGLHPVAVDAAPGDPTDPNPTGYFWADMTCTQNAGVSCVGGIVTRTAASSGYGAAYAQANETIAYGTGAVAVRINSANDVFSFGLTNTGTWNLAPSAITTPSGSSNGTSLTAPTFGFSFSGSGNYRIWNQESGRLFNPNSGNGVFQAGDWAIVYSDEGVVKYYLDHNGSLTLLYTSDFNPVAPSYPLLPQISISTNGASGAVKVLQPKAFGSSGHVFVSSTGTKYAAGTSADPIKLQAAIDGSRPVCGTSGNNDISIADGVYTAPFVATVSGTSGNLCKFHATNITYPPSVKITHATNDLTLHILGDYEQWKDVEIYNSSTVRVTPYDASDSRAGDDIHRADGWRTDGTGNQLINSVVHDEVDGIVSQTHGGTIARGNISYNNGFAQNGGVGDGAGHCAYVHNTTADNRSYMNNNVFFGCYGLQMQYYNQNSADATGNMTFDKDVAIGGMFGILGQGPKSDIIVSNTHVYNGSLKLGYSDEINGTGGVLDHNYVYGISPVQVSTWAGFSVTNNKIVGKADGGGRMLAINQKTGTPLSSYNISSNIYYRGQAGNLGPSPAEFNLFDQNQSPIASYTIAQWQAIPFDTNSTFYTTVNESGTPYGDSVAVRPGTTDVFVNPNDDQVGRANVVIWNWPLANNVNVNLSTAGLTNGQHYDVFSIQSGKKLISSATYNSSSPTVSFPMNTDDPAIPRIGDAASTPASAMPAFGVFLVMPSGGGGGGSPDTTPPVRSAGAPTGSLTAGTTSTSISLTTNETATCKYGTTAGVAYASLPNTFTSTNSTSHSTTVSGLTNGSTFNYYVRCQDSSSNANTNDFTITFSVSNPAGDSTAPTVSITAPTNGATVSGTSVSVTANASDNVGVAGVQFKLDGSNLGAEDTTSTYGITWNTTGASNGTHTLTAVARDAATNSTTSTGVNVTVNNVTPPSTVATPSIAPAGGSFTATQSVTLSTTTAGASIYYTTDGTTPTTSSNLYSSSFDISATTTIKAFAVKSSMTDSAVSSATFTKTTTSGGGGGGGGGASSPKPPVTPPVTPPANTSADHLINSNGTYYLIQSGQRKGVTSPGILYSCGFEFKNATTPTTTDNSLPAAGLLLPCGGALVKSNEDQTVYLVSAGKRYAFTSASVFTGLGFKFSSVLVVTNPELQAVPKSADVSSASSAHLPETDINSNGTVYWIDTAGQKHAYSSLDVYNSWHRDGDFSTVVPANSADLSLVTGNVVPKRPFQ